MNPRNRTIAIVGAVVLVVLVVLGIAVLASRGGDDASSDTTAGTTDGSGGSDAGAGATIEQTRPVEVIGDPLAQYPDAGADPAVGVTAPVLEGESFDGTPITIGGPTDGPTLVVFLAHWCPHCNREVPQLIALDDQGGMPAGLNVVGVSTAVNSAYPNYPPSQWLVDKGWPWPAMADSDTTTALQAYGGSGFPFEVLLDDQGVVLARQSGESTADEIKQWLEASLD